jgi:hypothetical protein
MIDPAELELEDLGLVNELEMDSEDDDDDEEREAIGDQSSNSTKWHKHTAKVLQLLQRKVREENDNNDDDEEEKPTECNFKTCHIIVLDEQRLASRRRNAQTQTLTSI